MKTKSKIISLIMALALVISSMPFVAFAEETDGVTTVSTYDAFLKAIETEGATIQLQNDISNTGSTESTLYPANGVTIDLNTFELDITTVGSNTSIVVSEYKTLTITNGDLVLNPETPKTDYNGAVISVETGGEITLDSVNYETNSAALYPTGDASAVTVTNSTIVGGCYGVATNATTSDHIVITLENSTISTKQQDSTPVFMNVVGELYVDNCIVNGYRQGIIVRGGEAEIYNTTVNIADCSSTFAQYTDGNWGVGNEVPQAAIVIGNRHASSYQYPTTVTMSGVTVNNKEGSYDLYMYGNSEENDATLKIIDEFVCDANQCYVGVNSTVSYLIVANQDELDVALAIGATDMSISGGTYTSDPSEYLYEGYTAVKNEDGTYTVYSDKSIKYEELMANVVELIESSTFEFDQADGNTKEEIFDLIEKRFDDLVEEAGYVVYDENFYLMTIDIIEFNPAVTDGANGSFEFEIYLDLSYSYGLMECSGTIVSTTTPSVPSTTTPSVPSTETAGESVVTPSISAESQATLVEEAGFTTAQIESGAELKVELSVNDKEEVTDDEQTSIDEAIEAYEGDLEVALVLDIDLTKYVGGVADGNITTLTTPIEITIDLPEKLQGKDLVIIRVHELSDGSLETDVIKDEDTDDKTFTFSTDKFSTYALAEVTTVTATATPEPTVTPDADVDEETTETPETGDYSNMALVVILMMTAFASGVIVLKKRLVK